jgi:hypothetical protein
MRTTFVAVSAGVALAIGTAAVLGTSVASAATAAKPHNEHQHFSVLSTRNGATPVVLATGVAHTLGKQQAAKGNNVKFVFADGSMTVLEKRQGAVKTSFDAKTCLHTVSAHGVWRTTRADGRYRGTMGLGLYHSQVRWVQCTKKGSAQVWSSDTELDGRLSD